MYTYWDYMRKRWERDAGLRLDQIVLSSELAGRLVAAGVDRPVRGEDNASGHQMSARFVRCSLIQ